MNAFRTMLALGFTLCLSFINARTQPATSEQETVYIMPPYRIDATRVLPAPESWHYISVPQLELTRGKLAVKIPAIEILSNLSEDNTKLFARELQLRQIANSLIWPLLVQKLPSKPIVVVIDRERFADISSNVNPGAWQDDPISSNHGAANTFDSDSGSTGVQFLIPDAGFRTIESPFDGSEPSVDSVTTRVNSAGAVGNTLNESQTTVFTQKRPFQPLPAGFVVVRERDGLIVAEVNGTTPLASMTRPTEEQLAGDLSRKIIQYGLSVYTSNAPVWFKSGLGWLVASTDITPSRINFGGFPPILGTTATLPLSELLKKTTALTYEEELLAAAFTHYALFSRNGKYAENFVRFVIALQSEPPSDTLFENTFGISMKKMEVELGTYSRAFAAYKSTEFKTDIGAEFPDYKIREASQAEVARLKACVLISRGKANQAIDTLRIAYWRGERESRMLELLGEQEELIGSKERAKKIVEHLMRPPNPSGKTLLLAAKNRFDQALQTPGPNGKIAKGETRQILSLIGSALESGERTETAFELLASVMLNSDGRPAPQINGLLTEAAKKFSLNETLQKWLKFSEPSLHP